MEIIFISERFQEFCSDKSKLTRRYGDVNAGRIHQRIAEMLAVDNLAQLYILPGPRCHELHGNRKGHFAVDINGELRLIFIPADNPIPHKPDGGILLKKVTMAQVIEISRHYKP